MSSRGERRADPKEDCRTFFQSTGCVPELRDLASRLKAELTRDDSRSQQGNARQTGISQPPTPNASPDELGERIGHVFEIFQKYFSAVEKERTRCIHNHEQISSDMQALQRDESKAHYEQALGAQETQLNRAIILRKALLTAFLGLVGVLLKAAEQESPLDAPSGSPPAGGLGPELEGLLSLGPHGR